MPTRLVVGVDVGTRSTKAVLTDAETGQVIAQASREHGIALPGGGAAEHDADAVWWDEVCATCRELVEAVPDGARIEAIGLSSCGPCLVPVDADGSALRPGILYGIDTRATAQVAALAEQWPDPVATAEFGMPFSSQSLVPKMTWVAEHEPGIAARTATWLTANGYVAFRLTGVQVMDHHQAGYCAPVYADGAWGAATATLPELTWSSDAIGTVTAGAAALSGLPAGIPVVIGSSDGATDPVGAGEVGGSTALLRYGSTLGVTVIAAGAGVPGLWRTPGNRPGEVMYVGGLSTAGSITSWFREQFARELDSGDSTAVAAAHAQLSDEAAREPAGSGGVLTLPYFSGERTPFSDPDARGVIAGLGLGTTRGALYRSVLEGTALALRHLVEVAAAGGIVLKRFRSVGGGTSGALWAQIVSDATGLPQQIVSPHLGAPLGAARLAAEGTGLVPAEAPAWATAAREVVPDPSAAERYDRLYQLFRDLYTATRGIIGGLREVTP